jgi:hypothetical protein
MIGQRFYPVFTRGKSLSSKAKRDSSDLPINFEQMTIGKPDVNRLNAAIASIKLGTYVHCEHGQDRTGLIIGAYRVKVEHWTKEQAYQEMLRFGFHPLLRGLCWSWEEDVP